MPTSSLVVRRALPIAGLVIGLWAALPPYFGPELDTETRVEIVDHVVPSLFLMAASVVALVLARVRPAPAHLLVAGFVVALAGIWMVATHVPLVAQAARHEVPAGAAAYHTAPGLAVVALGLGWIVAYWRQVP